MVKYGRGTFKGPSAVATLRGRTLYLSSDFGYENLLGWLFARFTPDEKYKVAGKILCYEDATKKLETLGLPLQGKRVKGVFEYQVKEELDKDTLVKLYELAMKPVFFVFIDARSSEGQLKTKKKFPQPTLEKTTIDFCKVRVPLSNKLLDTLAKELIPDFEVKFPFKKLLLKNTFKIEEIVLPENKEGLTPRQLRLLSKRKGVLIREVEVDGKAFKREQPFTC